MELCWSALKPWIANSVEIESATPYSVFEEVELAVGCPKEKDYYSSTFPGIDHLVQPITDGELKIFAHFHNEGNEKLPTFSRHMIEIFKYRIKVLDAEMDSNSRAGTSSDEDWSTPTTHRLVVMVEQFKVHNRLDDIFNSAWFITVERCRWDMDRIIGNTIRKRNLKSSSLIESNPILSEETRIDLMIRAQTTLSVPEPCLSETNSQMEEEKEENMELDVMDSPIGSPVVNSFHLLLSSDTDDEEHPTNNKERNEIVNDKQIPNLSPLKEVEEDGMEVDERNDEEQEISEFLITNVISKIAVENIASKTSENTCLEPEERIEKTSSLEPEENVVKISGLETEQGVEKTSDLELEESLEKTSDLEPEKSVEKTSDIGFTFSSANVNSVQVEGEKQGKYLEEIGNETLCSRDESGEVCAGKTVSTDCEIEPQILVELEGKTEINNQEIAKASLLFNPETDSQTNLMGVASLMEMINQTQSQITRNNELQSIFHNQNVNGETTNLTYSQVQMTEKEFVEIPNHSEMTGSSSCVVLENSDNLKLVAVTDNSLETDVKITDEESGVRNCNFNENESGKSVNEVFGSLFLPEIIDEGNAQFMCSSQSQSSSTFSPVFQSSLQVPIIIAETPFLPSIAEVMNAFPENRVRSNDVNRSKGDDGIKTENDRSIIDEASGSQVPKNSNFNNKFRMFRKRHWHSTPSKLETDVAPPPIHCFECSKNPKVEETVTEKVSVLQRVPRGSLPENDLKFLLESWKYVFSLTLPPKSPDLNDAEDVKNS